MVLQRLLCRHMKAIRWKILDGRISEDEENGKYEGKSIQILTI